MNNILSLKHINLIYHSEENETLALKDISFDVKRSEFISIVGPSGCGKTTILSLISGLIKPTSGKIETYTKRENPNGYMFQKDNLFSWRTIYKNIILGLEIQKRKDKESINYIKELAKKYDIYDFLSRYPSELSGGMRQRVALIRTLALKPEILLLDEPFSALDFQTRLNVCNDVASIIKEEKKTAILVTHDIQEAIAMSDRIVVLSKRPSVVKKIFELDFDKKLTPFERRQTKEFFELFDMVWKELNDEK